MCCMSAPLQEEEPGTRLRRMSSAMADAAQRLEALDGEALTPTVDQHDGSGPGAAAAAATQFGRSEQSSSLGTPPDTPLDTLPAGLGLQR